MRIAFLVLAHTDPIHLGRLCERLSASGDVFVHYDRKSNLSEVSSTLRARAYFVEPRIRVAWGAFSVVEATLALIRAALESGTEYRYFSLLSGLDYPIKPVSEFAAYLDSSYPKLFIRSCCVWDSPEHYAPMVRRFQFLEPWLRFRLLDRGVRRAVNVLLSGTRRTYFPHITPYFGSQFWTITRECAAMILEWSAKHPEFARYYRNVLASDEQYFHTIVRNSDFAEYAAAPEFHGRGTAKYANFHVIHPSLQKIYTIGDFQELARSTRFFVRKVCTCQSAPLLDRIDAELLR